MTKTKATIDPHSAYWYAEVKSCPFCGERHYHCLGRKKDEPNLSRRRPTCGEGNYDLELEDACTN